MFEYFFPFQIYAKDGSSIDAPLLFGTEGSSLRKSLAASLDPIFSDLVI